ncbi:hypothetical protein [Magnetospirillum molischianum]|uniref:Secreted protein n=1 Tax=Magnetospirillum molischianum DSM 120 TaxID=1150626 RepID=H8FX43_MAGML|nr:hypothetical protein [Magnetospirillum molischianum]CCG42931.1 exported hypothetical protein [Magnetospirillum molischianum DSM 120]
MHMLSRLCVVIGLGVLPTGSWEAATSASFPAVSSFSSGPYRGASVRGRAFAPVPVGGVLDEDESEDLTCPDWRSRQ